MSSHPTQAGGLFVDTNILVYANVALAPLHEAASTALTSAYTAGVTRTLCELLAELPTGGKQVHDASIVATMIVYGIPAFMTDNVKDFERFYGKIRIEKLAAD